MGAGLRDLEDRVWLRRELLQAGYNDKTIQRNLKEGRWHRVRHGAYCDAALWQELSAEDRHRLTARAVLRTSHLMALTGIPQGCSSNFPTLGGCHCSGRRVPVAA